MTVLFNLRLVRRGEEMEAVGAISHKWQETSTWLEESVDTLRQRLKEMNVWPDAGDQFLELLPHARYMSPPLTEADNQWLPQVVDAVVNGVDIGANYPAFFQKLITSDSLRRSFLQALDNKLKII